MIECPYCNSDYQGDAIGKAVLISHLTEAHRMPKKYVVEAMLFTEAKIKACEMLGTEQLPEGWVEKAEAWWDRTYPQAQQTKDMQIADKVKIINAYSNAVIASGGALEVKASEFEFGGYSIKCDRCDGTGFTNQEIEFGGALECPDCNGTGKIEMTSSIPDSLSESKAFEWKDDKEIEDDFIKSFSSTKSFPDAHAELARDNMRDEKRILDDEEETDLEKSRTRGFGWQEGGERLGYGQDLGSSSDLGSSADITESEGDDEPEYYDEKDFDEITEDPRDGEPNELEDRMFGESNAFGNYQDPAIQTVQNPMEEHEAELHKAEPFYVNQDIRLGDGHEAIEVFNEEDHPRDSDGKFGSGGGSSGGSSDVGDTKTEMPWTMGSKDVDASGSNYGFKTNDEGGLDLSLHEEGWNWSGDESDLIDYMHRVSGTEFKDDFVEELENSGVQFDTVKQQMIKNLDSPDALYAVSGDNSMWEHGDIDDDLEYLLDDEIEGREEELTDEQLGQVKEVMSSYLEGRSFGDFVESDHGGRLHDQLEETINNSNSFGDLFDAFHDENGFGYDKAEATMFYDDQIKSEAIGAAIDAVKAGKTDQAWNYVGKSDEPETTADKKPWEEDRTNIDGTPNPNYREMNKDDPEWDEFSKNIQDAGKDYFKGDKQEDDEPMFPKSDTYKESPPMTEEEEDEWKRDEFPSDEEQYKREVAEDEGRIDDEGDIIEESAPVWDQDPIADYDKFSGKIAQPTTEDSMDDLELHDELWNDNKGSAYNRITKFPMGSDGLGFEGIHTDDGKLFIDTDYGEKQISDIQDGVATTYDGGVFELTDDEQADYDQANAMEEFNEQDHPRDSDGKFGSGGGGSASAEPDKDEKARRAVPLEGVGDGEESPVDKGEPPKISEPYGNPSPKEADDYFSKRMDMDHGFEPSHLGLQEEFNIPEDVAMKFQEDFFKKNELSLDPDDDDFPEADRKRLSASALGIKTDGDDAPKEDDSMKEDDSIYPTQGENKFKDMDMKDIIKSVKGGSKDWHDWKPEEHRAEYEEIERRNAAIPDPEFGDYKPAETIFRDDPDAVPKMEAKIKYLESVADYWKKITKFPARDYGNMRIGDSLGDAKWYAGSNNGANLRDAKKKLEKIKNQGNLTRNTTYKTDSGGKSKPRFYYTEDPKEDEKEGESNKFLKEYNAAMGYKQ